MIWKCDMKELALFAIAIALIGCFAYGTWLVAKQVNYHLSYEAMVQKTVCEMVKPEHLKKPCK